VRVALPEIALSGRACSPEALAALPGLSPSEAMMPEETYLDLAADTSSSSNTIGA